MSFTSFKVPPKILRLPEVKYRTGLSRSSIYSQSNAGRFPRRVKIADRSVGWIESEINGWIETRSEFERLNHLANHLKSKESGDAS